MQTCHPSEVALRIHFTCCNFLTIEIGSSTPHESPLTFSTSALGKQVSNQRICPIKEEIALPSIPIFSSRSMNSSSKVLNECVVGSLAMLWHHLNLCTQSSYERGARRHLFHTWRELRVLMLFGPTQEAVPIMRTDLCSNISAVASVMEVQSGPWGKLANSAAKIVSLVRLDDERDQTERMVAPLGSTAVHHHDHR